MDVDLYLDEREERELCEAEERAERAKLLAARPHVCSGPFKCGQPDCTECGVKA